LRRDIAKTIPAAMVAGRAGGTAIVIRSKDLSISFSFATPSLIS